jgi:3-deoxy-manno-octulosonate cytidylyltransferase (CMP-KDO synthetase)
MLKNVAIIPARLNSKRFPNKILYKFNEKRIIDHVIENARGLNFIDDIVIASDDIEFAKSLCDKYSFIKEYHISNDVTCGSHRAYKYFLENDNYDFYITIPADEPAINPIEVNKTFNNYNNIHLYEIITFYTKFYCKEDLISPLSCKIVATSDDYMIYNSRTVVPVNKDATHLDLEQYKKHVGIFIFPNQVFFQYGDIWQNTVDIESLEQNRFIQKRLKVKMLEIKHIGFGIDMPEQIKQLEERLKKGAMNGKSNC